MLKLFASLIVTFMVFAIKNVNGLRFSQNIARAMESSEDNKLKEKPIEKQNECGDECATTEVLANKSDNIDENMLYKSISYDEVCAIFEKFKDFNDKVKNVKSSRYSKKSCLLDELEKGLYDTFYFIAKEVKDLEENEDFSKTPKGVENYFKVCEEIESCLDDFKKTNDRKTLKKIKNYIKDYTGKEAKSVLVDRELVIPVKLTISDYCTECCVVDEKISKYNKLCRDKEVISYIKKFYEKFYKSPANLQFQLQIIKNGLDNVIKFVESVLEDKLINNEDEIVKLIEFNVVSYLRRLGVYLNNWIQKVEKKGEEIKNIACGADEFKESKNIFLEVVDKELCHSRLVELEKNKKDLDMLLNKNDNLIMSAEVKENKKSCDIVKYKKSELDGEFGDKLTFHNKNKDFSMGFLFRVPLSNAKSPNEFDYDNVFLDLSVFNKALSSNSCLDILKNPSEETTCMPELSYLSNLNMCLKELKCVYSVRENKELLEFLDDIGSLELDNGKIYEYRKFVDENLGPLVNTENTRPYYCYINKSCADNLYNEVYSLFEHLLSLKCKWNSFEDDLLKNSSSPGWLSAYIHRYHVETKQVGVRKVGPDWRLSIDLSVINSYLNWWMRHCAAVCAEMEYIFNRDYLFFFEQDMDDAKDIYFDRQLRMIDCISENCATGVAHHKCSEGKELKLMVHNIYYSKEYVNGRFRKRICSKERVFYKVFKLGDDNDVIKNEAELYFNEILNAVIRARAKYLYSKLSLQDSLNRNLAKKEIEERWSACSGDEYWVKEEVEKMLNKNWTGWDAEKTRKAVEEEIWAYNCEDKKKDEDKKKEETIISKRIKIEEKELIDNMSKVLNQLVRERRMEKLLIDALPDVVAGELKLMFDSCDVQLTKSLKLKMLGYESGSTEYEREPTNIPFAILRKIEKRLNSFFESKGISKMQLDKMVLNGFKLQEIIDREVKKNIKKFALSIKEK